MYVEEVFASPRLENFVSRVVRLASEELGIAPPRVRWFGMWSGRGTYWKALDVNIGGFARPLEGVIALRRDLNLDRVTHIALHEVRHMQQPEALRGDAAEEDACRFAREFQSRRFDELLQAMTDTQVSDTERGTGSARCWCEEG